MLKQKYLFYIVPWAWNSVPRSHYHFYLILIVAVLLYMYIYARETVAS